MKWDVLQQIFLVYRGGGSKGAQTTVNQMYSPEEAARRATVMGEAERIFGTAPTAPPPTGASADTLAAQERLRQYSTGTGQQLAGQLAGAQQFGLQGVLDPASNPYYQQYQESAIRPITEAYLEPGGVQSQLRSHFGQGPGVGTREAIAQGIAGRGYLNAIGDVTAKMGSQAYGQGLDVFGRTMALAPQTMQAGMMPALAQGAVGLQQEQYAEEQRAWQANAPWANLQNYANVVFGGSSPTSVSTAQGPGMTAANRAGLALGGASMGYMAGAQAGSIGGPYGAMIGGAAGLLLSYL